MPIRADRNMYPGINPHLNSALQQSGGGWQRKVGAVGRAFIPIT